MYLSCFLKYFKSKAAKLICIGRNLGTLMWTTSPEAIYSFLKFGVDIGLLKEPGLYSFLFSVLWISNKPFFLGQVF